MLLPHLFTLCVSVPPSIKQGSTTLTATVSETQDVNLTCYAAGYPTPNITWMRPNGHTMPKPYTDKITVKVSKKFASSSQNGFYPTALKGCRGIVFTHGVQMGWWAGGRCEKVCPGCISETVRCRKLILGRDIG